MVKIFDFKAYRTYRVMDEQLNRRYHEVSNMFDPYRREQAIYELERLAACVDNAKEQYLSSIYSVD